MSTEKASFSQQEKSLFNMGTYDAIRSHTKQRYVWNKHMEPPFKSKFGSTSLPCTNMTPVSLAQKKQELPHTQLSSQNFMNINPLLVVPTSFSDVRTVSYAKETLVIPVLRKGVLTEDDMMSILSVVIGIFFKDKYAGEAVTHDEIYIAYLTLYGSTDLYMTSNIANTGSDVADKRFEYLDFADTKMYVTCMFEKLPYLFDVITELNEANVISLGVLLSYLCVCLQTIGKQVNDDNVTNWFRNRLRAIMAKLGAGTPEAYENVRPETKTLITGNRSLNFMFEFRRMLIDRMFQYRKVKSRLGTVFDMVLAMVAGMDLTHVYNIDVYLMQSMPELMNLQMLRPYDDQLVQMYSFWKQHEDIFPYVRFYVPVEQCHAINRTTLYPLIAASQAVAMYVSDTFKNYKGAQLESDLYKEVSQIVRRYIEIRASMAATTLGLSNRAIIDDLERTMYLDKAQNAESAGTDDKLLRDLNRLDLAE